MAEFLQKIGPEWIIVAVGAVVGFGIYVILRNVGQAPEPTPQLEVEAEPGKHGERRSAPRKRTSPVLVDLVDPDGVRPRQSGIVHDVSTGGLAVKCQDEVPVGTHWTVLLRSAPGAVKQGIPVEIRACVRQEGAFLVSCQFLRTVGYNELLNFS